MTEGDPPIPEARPEPSSPEVRRRLRRVDTSYHGEDLGRIISLSDGVFAFALTLLVLSIAVPHVTGNGELGAALHNDFASFYGYAFAFVMIALWWVIHNRTFQNIARFDSTLVWINMALLAQIAVMPFALTIFADYSPDQYAIILFASVQITLGLTTTILWEYARRRHLIKPNVSPALSRYFTRRGYLTALVFLASIGLTFISVTAAELSWIAIFFVQRFLTIEGD